MLSHFFLWRVVTVTTTKTGEEKYLDPVNLGMGRGKLMSRFELRSRHPHKCCGGGVLKTCNQNVKRWRVPRMVKTYKRYGPSAPTQYHSSWFPYKAPGDSFEGKQGANLQLTLSHILHHTSQPPTSRQLVSSLCHKPLDAITLPQLPKDSLEMPQWGTVTVGNRAWICHLPVRGHKGCNAGEVRGTL